MCTTICSWALTFTFPCFMSKERCGLGSVLHFAGILLNVFVSGMKQALRIQSCTMYAITITVSTWMFSTSFYTVCTLCTVQGQVIPSDQQTLPRRPQAYPATDAPQPPSHGPPDQEDRLSTQSEADTSPTGGGFRRGGRLRNSLPVVRSPNRSMERPMGKLHT